MEAKRDKTCYEKGKKILDKEMEKLNIEHDEVNPQWNYTIKSSNKKRAEK